MFVDWSGRKPPAGSSGSLAVAARFCEVKGNDASLIHEKALPPGLVVD
jgi:hypothetical protein